MSGNSSDQTIVSSTAVSRQDPFSDERAIDLKKLPAETTMAQAQHNADIHPGNPPEWEPPLKKGKKPPTSNPMIDNIFWRATEIIGTCVGGEVLYKHTSHGNPKFGNYPTGIHRFETLDTLNNKYFFIWKYLPCLLAMFYGFGWRRVHEEVSHLYPYSRLFSLRGAKGRDSICMEYVGLTPPVAFYRAIRAGHYPIALATLGHFIAAVIFPAVQAGVFKVIRVPPDVDANGLQGMYVIIVDRTVLTTIYAILGVTAIIGFALVWSLHTHGIGRRLGYISTQMFDPLHLGALVEGLHGGADIKADFAGLEGASMEEINSRIADNTYRVDVDADTGIFSLVRVSPAHSPTSPLSTKAPPTSESAVPALLRLPATLTSLFFLALLLATILIISLLPSASLALFQHPFVLVFTASLFRQIFFHPTRAVYKECESLRALASPGWVARLSSHPVANPAAWGKVTLTLPISLLHWWTSIFTEYLHVAVAGVIPVHPNNLQGESGRTLGLGYMRVNAPIITAIVLVLVYAVGIVSLWYYRGRSAPYPRRPTSVASNIAYLAGAKWLHEDARGLALTGRFARKRANALLKKLKDVDGEEVLKDYNSKEGLYGFGFVTGEQGVARLERRSRLSGPWRPDGIGV